MYKRELTKVFIKKSYCYLGFFKDEHKKIIQSHIEFLTHSPFIFLSLTSKRLIIAKDNRNKKLVHFI